MKRTEIGNSLDGNVRFTFEYILMKIFRKCFVVNIQKA